MPTPSTKADVRIRVQSTARFREITPLELAVLDTATKRVQQDIEAALRVADFLRRMRKIRKTLPA